MNIFSRMKPKKNPKSPGWHKNLHQRLRRDTAKDM